MSKTRYRGDLDKTLHGAVLWRINKWFNDPDIRQKIAQDVASLLPAQDLYDTLDIDSETRQRADHLVNEGYTVIEPPLDSTRVSDLVSYFVTVKDVEPERTLRHYKIADIVRAPHALDIATHPSILAAVGTYLGAVPTLLDLCAWWSDPTVADAFGAQIPHRDRDDFKFCKVFVYLTDVGPEDGPHTYLPGSHSKAGMEQLFHKNGLQQNDAIKAFQTDSRAYAGWILDTFREDMVEFTGVAGTMFMVNTFGYHFGQVPRQSSRLVFQAVYGQMGSGYRADRLQQTHDLPLSPHIAEDPIKSYCCRLIGQAVPRG